MAKNGGCTMSNLYHVLSKLCNDKGISGYRMCKDVGIQPSIMTDLKMGRRSSVKAETANRIAEYFNVSVAYLLGEVEKPPALTMKNTRNINDDDLMFALWGDSDDIDKDDLEDVKRYAAFLRDRKKKKRL